ncbi:MAG: hypothetical protein ACYS3S_00300 [Planctomycetota bacterium]|jgi:hypothetical protein
MSKEIRITKNNLLIAVLLIVIPALIPPGLITAAEQKSPSVKDYSKKYFKIQAVDRQTGRGVPLVELRTTNNTRYYTDSNGIVAYYEPGLMDREVFFFVESHGYEFPKDGFGFHGTRLKTSAGSSAVIKIDRLNIAERLYRVTGQGIYRDSILTGTEVPLKNPVLNGQVTGQDSVYTCIYQGRLFWLWGDTNRPSYPLGHFWTAGAVSDLPGKGGLDPAIGVNLEYFVDETGFSTPICRMKEKGLVWLDGLLTVQGSQGHQRMVAMFARLKDLGEVLERGLVAFNDSTGSFEPIVRSGPDFLPYHNSGHTLAVDVDGERYYYFATQFPLSVRMRIKAEWDYVIDPNRYEVLTSPKPSEPCRWIRAGELIGNDASQMPTLVKTLKEEKKDTHLYDITSGKKVTPHGGSVYFNDYRQRWVTIFVQQFGESSYLGELWYAEADTPVGPWGYARKIATHNKYSFYNPMRHPYFDKDDGRVIFFEGTYTFTFSGSLENATPRYDYNQIMYRLNLDDPRLALPAAVYQVRDEPVGWANSVLPTRNYLLRAGVEKANKWDSVESIPFYAFEPKRAHSNLIPIYAQSAGLTAKRPDTSAEPLFYALPSSGPESENSCIAALYEYYNTKTKRRIYSTNPARQKKGWKRSENPLCRVWKAPPGPLLRDGEAKPTAGH